MHVEPITGSEVGQKEKNKHCMLTQISGVEHHVGDTEHATRRAANKTQTYKEQTWDSVGEGEGGLM